MNILHKSSNFWVDPKKWGSDVLTQILDTTILLPGLDSLKTVTAPGDMGTTLTSALQTLCIFVHKQYMAHMWRPQSVCVVPTLLNSTHWSLFLKTVRQRSLPSHTFPGCLTLDEGPHCHLWSFSLSCLHILGCVQLILRPSDSWLSFSKAFISSEVEIKSQHMRGC